MIRNFDELLQAATQVGKRRALIVAPANRETFDAIQDARQKLDLEFLLVGDRKTIEAALPDLRGIDIVDRPDVGECLAASMELLAHDKADILMKGGVDTATLIKAALQPESNLRTGRLLSDVFLFEYAARPENKLVMITDGGLCIAPDLEAKVQLIQNAVVVAHALGNASPKVAVLSASEFVQPSMPSTLDAAALSQMNARGQIKGCVVDGPLALDNALAARAAEEKRIGSQVAGAAEILVCPSIESANMLAKSTTYIGNARLAHVIMGARIPILIPSRADKSDAKLLSLALGMIMTR
ncbi:MAG TPA: bifunctional enoyl-CoA hydratase/phosphate acetyltransferase [Bryobacteraceae bacterium]|nr:bifunctional enoyl-CoA hydratase/phosphate acetyltransferase [Bryobacteraceae bacterium]